MDQNVNELENLEIEFQMNDNTNDLRGTDVLIGDDIINPMEDAAHYQGSFQNDNVDDIFKDNLDRLDQIQNANDEILD